MGANYVVRPFAGFWQHFAKILMACTCVFDRLPKSVQLVTKARKTGQKQKDDFYPPDNNVFYSPQYYYLHTLLSSVCLFL